ncbi:hypothetical protein FACS189487_04300 [Campylobacterota bacterium]|nr:hypothetical protein FACS189487_04300 [Campylobacterota bacterium]
MRINIRWFILYKTINSLFGGLSLGAIIGIYSSLRPQIFSAGGFLLAIGSIIVALFYSRIMNIKAFFIVTLIAESVILFAAFLVVFDPSSWQIACAIYICYQITFLFGGYLIRAETLFLNNVAVLSRVDAFKQIGYIIGLAASYIFYELTDLSKIGEIWLLHIYLVSLQTLTIVCVLRAFIPR